MTINDYFSCSAAFMWCRLLSDEWRPLFFRISPWAEGVWERGLKYNKSHPLLFSGSWLPFLIAVVTINFYLPWLLIAIFHYRWELFPLFFFFSWETNRGTKEGIKDSRIWALFFVSSFGGRFLLLSVMNVKPYMFAFRAKKCYCFFQFSKRCCQSFWYAASRSRQHLLDSMILRNKLV